MNMQENSSYILHEGFVELEELIFSEDRLEWKETARWIKLEEDVDEYAERWGKPHIPCLTFRSLQEVRTSLENGVFLLDLRRNEIPTISEAVVNEMIQSKTLNQEEKDVVIAALLTRHRHMHQKKRKSKFSKTFTRRMSVRVYHEPPNEVDKTARQNSNTTPPNYESLDVIKGSEITTVPFRDKFTEDFKPSENEKGSDIKSKVPKNAEATTVLVGAHGDLTSPVSAFVRLGMGCNLGNLAEVSIPVRFLFIFLGPVDDNINYHEVGRAFSTLMSDKVFLEAAYRAKSREDIINSMDHFMNDTLTIPPGDWDRTIFNNTVPILTNQCKEVSQRRHQMIEDQIKAVQPSKSEIKEMYEDPLERTKRFCGGLIRDIKMRFPAYASDFKDAFNLQCVLAVILVYFACLAPCVAFGGLLSESTKAWMGVSEMILSTALSGVLFALFAGQPLIIICATGPILVFEKNTFQLCESFGLEYLPWRAWVGIWVMLICFCIVACEGCILIRYFTRFTEEIFACLISIIFIADSFYYLDKVFKKHPLDHDTNTCLNDNISGTHTQKNEDFNTENSQPLPNTALLSTMLMLGTFFLSYNFRKLRHSHYFSHTIRRIFCDFGVLLSILAMVLFDLWAEGVYTQKLSVPDGFKVTSPEKRGWVINPMGDKKTMSGGWIMAAFIPASLVSILIFIEVEFSGIILDKKDNKLKKWPGYNLDLFVVGLLVGLCSILGLPWMCATPVHTVSHLHSLMLMSTDHAPGEHARLVEVKEQRVTNIIIHVLIGFSVFLSPVLRLIPIAVLFGVFLYLGVMSLSHIQFLDRVKLLIVPQSHHPDESYVRNVKTSKMHLFTIIQVLCVGLLCVIKLTDAAPGFPFFVVCLIPLRKFLERFFTATELEELDNEIEEVYDSDMDEFDSVPVPV